MRDTAKFGAETTASEVAEGIDLSGKVALVTGVGDNESFAWFIAKALQAAGARLVFGVHPRMIRIVDGFLTSDKPEDVASRVINGACWWQSVAKYLKGCFLGPLRWS